MASQQFFHVSIDFKTKEEISLKLCFNDKCSKSSSVFFIKQREKVIVSSLFNISE